MKTIEELHIELAQKDIDISQKDEEILRFKQENRELSRELQYVKHELAQLKRMIYGSKSERYLSEDTLQLLLDLGFEDQEVNDLPTETITYQRKTSKSNDKKRPVRLALPSHLPRKEYVIEPEEDISNARKIGEKITEILEYHPGELFVKKYVRPKYVLPEAQGIVIGTLPTLPIPKGNAGPGLLARLIIDKYVDHLPFYRQVQRFKREGVDIAESTVHGWFTATCKLLEPLYYHLRKRVCQEDYLMVDETPIPVLTKDRPGSTHKGYQWVYYSPIKKLVLFDYRKGRSRDGPKEILKDFKGTIQADGYSAYDIFENKKEVTLLACMAHARRKFEQSLDNDPGRANFAMLAIQSLYEIEKDSRLLGYSYTERKKLRDEKSSVVMHQFGAWLKKEQPQVLPKSAIGQAINYTIDIWPRLIRYLDNGRYEIDNNLVENSIRPIALGRKNYLFAGSHQAAERIAMAYSFLGTCKLNDINPFEWLKDVLSRIPDHSIQKLDELLPGNWKSK